MKIQKLYEDRGLLNESPRTYLNGETSQHIRSQAFNALSGEEVYVPAEKGQTSLLSYLCLNSGVSVKGNCVHHINFNHSDYTSDNICVIPNSCHNYLHTVLVSQCINDWLSYKGITKTRLKKKLKPSDISRDDIRYIFDLYREKALEYIDANRVDKKFQTGGH